MNSKVTHINVGNLAENCWFLANEDTKEAVVIDPGAEPDRISATAEKHGWKITAILLTHGHIDHMGACESLRTELRVKVYVLTEEEDLLLDAKKNLSVQVHPDDDYARKYENGQLGKTEMWYVMDAAPDAQLVHRDIRREDALTTWQRQAACSREIPCSQSLWAEAIFQVEVHLH